MVEFGANVTRRKELNGVAAGLVGSFVSRNNDVGGYWALGQLRSLADAKHVAEIRLDILHGSAAPDAHLSAIVAERYGWMLQRQLLGRRIQPAWVQRAEISLAFQIDEADVPAWASYGEPFRCTALLVDDRGGEHQRSVVGRCAPHDPARESKSARA